MKILKIDERGIILLEDEEIISQCIYEEVEDIPYEVYELLSNFEKLGEIKIELEIEVDEEVFNSIEEILKDKGGIVLKNSRKVNINLKLILIPIVIQSIVGLFIWREGEKKKEKIIEIEGKIKLLEKKIVVEREKIKKNSVYRSIRYDFPKYRIVKVLEKISGIFKEKGYIQQFEIKNGKLNIFGFSDSLENCFIIKSELENEFGLNKVQFDYLKKEGEGLFFLIELKIN